MRIEDRDFIREKEIKTTFSKSFSKDETGYVEFTVDFDLKNPYVFFPACAYDGNAFDVIRSEYAPMFEPLQDNRHVPTTISDVPRLNKDKSGKIEVTAGDLSTPCVGVFSKTQKRALFVFSVQEAAGENLGFSYAEGAIRITLPAQREKVYSICKLTPAPLKTKAFKKGETVSFPVRILCFPCDDLREFYRVFFINRKCMGLDCRRPENADKEKQLQIQLDKFDRMNYREHLGIYAVGTNDNRFQVWQPGWTGGAISTLPILAYGNAKQKERALKTLDFLVAHQKESGLFAGGVDAEGNEYSDVFGKKGGEDWLLIRKATDVLFYIFDHFDVMKELGMEIPARYSAFAKRLADAVCEVFRKNGELGQFVSVKTLEVQVGNSTSGASGVAGLVKSYRYFGDKKYLDTAESLARLYLGRDIRRGFTTGGPGDALQCPDSESAFALLEGFVSLYSCTGAETWLDAAKLTAYICSSWVCSYNYRFPERSEFGRVGIRTCGTVFANVQNKHSAPGICTMSGKSLCRLYEITKDGAFLELIEDIANAISQCMSTEERPIYSWDDVPQRLPPGVMCERVNTSDWEGENCVGGVFNLSCWCETSNLLTLLEIFQLKIRKENSCHENV